MNLSKFFVLTLISGLLSIFSSCKTESYHSCEGMVWNTLYHITYKGPETLQDSIMPVLDRVSKSLSIFDPASLVSQLNNSDSIKADSHLLTVYNKSLEINSLSAGMFDPTVSPLITAWGFGPGHVATPDTAYVDSLLQIVGIEKTHLKGDYIYKDNPEIQFNFSAIAKGYGCDAVGTMFKRNGVDDYMVEIGGEISLSGESPSGKDWRISVDAPSEENESTDHQSFIVIELSDVGIATSGNYRNFHKENGVKTAHTISPKTGRPFITSLLSATVVAPTCMEADAIATACMASEPDKAKHLIQTSETDALLIFEDSVWMSPGFKKYISK